MPAPGAAGRAPDTAAGIATMNPSRFDPCPSRRRLLALGGLGALAPRRAVAELRGRVVFGREGWLFGAWEDIRRVNLQNTRTAASFLGRVADEFRRSGIELLLTLSPARARTYADMLPPDFQPNPDARQRYAALLAALRRTGALVPDLAAALQAQRQAGPEPVFFRTDTHWTGLGAEAAAIETAKLIKEKVTLPAAARKGTPLGGWETRTYPGEFRSLMTPAEAAKVPAQESYRVHAARFRYASAAGELVEEEANDVVIVGNSYMLPQFGFPQMLSNQLDRPVGLALKAQRVGPFRILLDYLGSSQFKAQPRPKLILWHFLEGSADQMPEAKDWWGEGGAMAAPDFLAALGTALGGR